MTGQVYIKRPHSESLVIISHLWLPNVHVINHDQCIEADIYVPTSHCSHEDRLPQMSGSRDLAGRGGGRPCDAKCWTNSSSL